MSDPVRVFTELAPSGDERILATPKSRIFTCNAPSALITSWTLCGFRSR